MKFFYLVVLGSCLAIFGNRTFAQQVKGLPDAPAPDISYPKNAAHQDVAEKYAKYIDPGQAALSLSKTDKIVLSFREQAKLWAFTTPVLAAGWEHLLDSNPHYGTDKAGFGERLGASVLLQNSQAVLTDGFAAAAFHEDPRFYRMGGRKIGRRILYAASRAIISRTDQGKPTVDYARLVGYAGASALTMTYYPAASARWRDVWTGYGISFSAVALGNMLHEFAPDVVHLLVRKGH